MTYKEIVNRIQDVVNDHYMLCDFGYGDLSDLKTRFENTSGNSEVQADYPYLFLNPATHTRTGAAVTYNFNMIVMDIARGEVSDQPYDNILTIQSQCQQYIDDVIAQLWNGYTDPPQVLWDGLSYNTFNERFQDDVAGMTVNLQIVVPQAINNCITPFVTTPTPTPEGNIILDAATTVNYLIRPDITQDPLRWQDVTLDTFNGIRTTFPYNAYTINRNGTWTFTLEGVVRRTSNGAQWPDSVNLAITGLIDLEPTSTTWPVDPTLGVDYAFRCVWNAVPLGIGDGSIQWRCSNIPAVEDTGLILPGCELKGYYIAS